MCDQIRNSCLINSTFRCDYVNLSTSIKMNEIGRWRVAKLFRFISSFLRTLYLLVVKRYKLCYVALTCHGPGFIKDSVFALLCKFFGNKLVIHQHNKGMSEDIGRWPYRWLVPLVYRKATVVLLSWKLYPDVSCVAAKDQIVICPNGIPDPLSVAGIHRNGGQVPRILFLSNLLAEKGVWLLLEACRILKDQNCSFICDIVGNETVDISADQLKDAVASMDLRDVVLYHGAQYGEDKVRFLSNSDVFVFPTRYKNEAFPLVLLEALQHSLPVVCSDVGGISDIVKDGDNGFLCSSDSAMDLATKLRILLDDSLLRIKMGQRGHELYRSNFTLDVWESNLMRILTEDN